MWHAKVTSVTGGETPFLLLCQEVSQEPGLRNKVQFCPLLALRGRDFRVHHDPGAAEAGQRSHTCFSVNGLRRGCVDEKNCSCKEVGSCKDARPSASPGQPFLHPTEYLSWETDTQNKEYPSKYSSQVATNRKTSFLVTLFCLLQLASVRHSQCRTRI